MTGNAAGSLFNQKTVENAIKGFTFPTDLADKHRQIEGWIDTLQSGRLTNVKEVSLHGQFLNDIFQTVLGYRSIIEGDRWDLHAEQTIADGGGFTSRLIRTFLWLIVRTEQAISPVHTHQSQSFDRLDRGTETVSQDLCCFGCKDELATDSQN